MKTDSGQTKAGSERPLENNCFWAADMTGIERSSCSVVSNEIYIGGTDFACYHGDIRRELRRASPP